MNKIRLSNLQLKTFTEQDASDYCQINNINPENITELFLHKNKLTDISGIKLFKNLEELNLRENELSDISVLKDLNKLEAVSLSENLLKDISVLSNLENLKYLNIQNLRLESDQIQYINLCIKLKELYCYNGFKNMSIKEKINKNIIIKY